MSSPLRAVVADDSALYRAVLSRALIDVGGVEIVGQVANGSDAVEQVKRVMPDLLTLDLNMPILDGLGALRALRAAKLECEVIVVSAETRQGAATTLEALQLGAVDFITKPTEDSGRASTEVLVGELRRKLAAIRLRRDHRRHNPDRHANSSKLPAGANAPCPVTSAVSGVAKVPDVVAIGTSTGGPGALPILLGAIPEDFSVPILVVQHMPPLFTASLAESLDRKCPLRVVEAHNGQLVQKGHVYVAPGGRHMKVRRAFDRSVRIAITDEVPENFCRPSVDVLYRSVAEEYGGRVVAAILTGMGNDGVAGLRMLKKLGATVVAQDEPTCVVFGMPHEAIRAGVVDRVLPLERIAPMLIDALRSNAQ